MLKELRHWLKHEKQDRSIFDIVLYGSAMKGASSPNDLDIIVIFREGTLSERLSKIQSLKQKIKLSQKIDIKGILLGELFQESFFARSGIFFEGISIFTGKPFAYKIGFVGRTLFSYTLRDKSHAQKVKFDYLLSGRGGIGLIKKFDGKHLGPGIVLIPSRHCLKFEEIMKRNQIEYSKNNILIESTT